MPASFPSFAIFGSCISRDTVELGFKGSPGVATYVARHSLISAGHPAEQALGTVKLDSKFQSRVFAWDLEGSGLRRTLTAVEASHALLVDITDERHGIYLHPDGGVITRSVDGIRAGVYDLLDSEWRHIPFGSLEHLALYAEAATHFAAALSSRNVLSKTFLISAPWATQLDSGASTPSSMGLRAAEANESIPLYEEILEKVGLRKVSAAPEHVVGDSHHKWGPAPFHYITSFYTDIANQITAALSDQT